MKQYYKSYYLKDFNKVDINFIEEIDFGYLIFFNQKLDCTLGHVIDKSLNVSEVIYYNDILSQEIINYHKSNYGDNISLALAQELPSGIKIEYYINYTIALYHISIYYKDGKPRLRQEFNKNFELVEYVQCIYDTEGTLIEEKFFYADSWTIHKEKMI
jgi:hypothetical protein